MLAVRGRSGRHECATIYNFFLSKYSTDIRMDAETTREAQTQTRQFCTFRIRGRLYGIDIKDVKEVSPETSFTKIFHAPSSVKGYMNIRGRIYLLLDLRQMLGLETKAVDDTSRVILFKDEVDENFGILVDHIADIVTTDEAQIENRRKQDHGAPEAEERRGIDIAFMSEVSCQRVHTCNHFSTCTSGTYTIHLPPESVNSRSLAIISPAWFQPNSRA